MDVCEVTKTALQSFDLIGTGKFQCWAFSGTSFNAGVAWYRWWLGASGHELSPGATSILGTCRNPWRYALVTEEQSHSPSYLAMQITSKTDDADPAPPNQAP